MVEEQPATEKYKHRLIQRMQHTCHYQEHTHQLGDGQCTLLSLICLHATPDITESSHTCRRKCFHPSQLRWLPCRLVLPLHALLQKWMKEEQQQSQHFLTPIPQKRT